ncbi:hypothetical protein ACFYKX_10720 [Cytobacillus sp. FJAT-54145]|uniref:Uncharacterized protein n=1 Tax=Cytobacillus spartinae TaxID=3299023 RepID=A0ABW6KA47_9BACI
MQPFNLQPKYPNAQLLEQDLLNKGFRYDMNMKAKGFVVLEKANVCKLYLDYHTNIWILYPMGEKESLEGKVENISELMDWLSNSKRT